MAKAPLLTPAEQLAFKVEFMALVCKHAMASKAVDEWEAAEILTKVAGATTHRELGNYFEALEEVMGSEGKLTKTPYVIDGQVHWEVTPLPLLIAENNAFFDSQGRPTEKLTQAMLKTPAEIPLSDEEVADFKKAVSILAFDHAESSEASNGYDAVEKLLRAIKGLDLREASLLAGCNPNCFKDPVDNLHVGKSNIHTGGTRTRKP